VGSRGKIWVDSDLSNVSAGRARRGLNSESHYVTVTLEMIPIRFLHYALFKNKNKLIIQNKGKAAEAR
jgi:hypothetical protein